MALPVKGRRSAATHYGRMPDPPVIESPPCVRCTVFKNGSPEREAHDLGEISEILKEPGTLVWLDAIEPDAKSMATLQEEFKLHPLAVEDAMTAHERPKIDGYGDYWFLVIYGVSVTNKAVTIHELSIFSGKNYLITVRREPAYPIDEVKKRWRARPETSSKDSGALLFTVLDTIVDGYFVAVESLDEQISAIENDLLRGGMVSGELPLRIFALKRDLQRFRRAAVPMRDILNPIIRGDLVLYKNEEIAYFRDVYDHAIRVIDQLDAARDLLNNALEINLSIVANRQNAIVKQLTVIATVFLPLTFITGFFGQNFGYLVSRIGSTWSFWALGIGAQVATLVGLLWFFKAKRWF